MHTQVIKPLEIAKVYFDFRDLPLKMLYNDHFSIVILDEKGEEYRLPFYLSLENNGVTNKRELLVIRVFNWGPVDQEFQVGLYLFHGLFIPYLELLSDKVWIEMYQAERQ